MVGGAKLAGQADPVCAADSDEALYEPPHQQARGAFRGSFRLVISAMENVGFKHIFLISRIHVILHKYGLLYLCSPIHNRYVTCR